MPDTDYYYYATAGGRRIWWKKYLTTMQITQFVIDLFVVYFASTYLVLPSQSRSKFLIATLFCFVPKHYPRSYPRAIFLAF